MGRYLKIKRQIKPICLDFKKINLSRSRNEQAFGDSKPNEIIMNFSNFEIFLLENNIFALLSFYYLFVSF